MPTDTRTADGRLTPDEADLLAPFVAWMATQDLAEHIRREYREAIEAFLRWRRDDAGPGEGVRRRYAAHLVPDDRVSADRALDRFAEYRHLRSRTLPTEEHH